MSEYSRSRLLCALLALMLCSGCAVMSESECVNANWREVGRNDGLEGKRAEELGRYQDACLQYGVTPDGEAYGKGREEGLAIYCTADTGYWEGRNGGSYRQVCPPSTARDFLEAYRAGQAVLKAIDTARSIEADIDSAKDRIGNLEDEIKKLESPEDSEDEERPAGTVEERRKEIDELRGELKVLRAWRVVHFSEYVDAVDAARRLGYQEEYPPWPGWTPCVTGIGKSPLNGNLSCPISKSCDRSVSAGTGGEHAHSRGLLDDQRATRARAVSQGYC